MRSSWTATPTARVAMLGLCPKCEGWFSCDDFFDVTVAIDHPETTTATVVSVAGTLDAAPMTRLLDMLTAQYAHGDVVIDLNGVMMTSPSAIRSLVARLSAWADTATLRIVCDRLTARRLLRKWGGGALPLVSTMTAALDSLGPATVRRR